MCLARITDKKLTIAALRYVDGANFDPTTAFVFYRTRNDAKPIPTLNIYSSMPVDVPENARHARRFRGGFEAAGTEKETRRLLRSRGELRSIVDFHCQHTQKLIDMNVDRPLVNGSVLGVWLTLPRSDMGLMGLRAILRRNRGTAGIALTGPRLRQ